MKLEPLELIDMHRIVLERNKVQETLRTPIKLNTVQQLKWFEDVVCDRRSDTRYNKIVIDKDTIGYGGIENIQWDNRLGEISVLIFENYRGNGHGKEAVKLILDNAFKNINLENVWGECYTCSPAVKFWLKLIKEYKAFYEYLPARKYYKGVYWGSLYFNFSKILLLIFNVSLKTFLKGHPNSCSCETSSKQ